MAARPTTSLVFGAMVCYDLSISRLEKFNVNFFHGIQYQLRRACHSNNDNMCEPFDFVMNGAGPMSPFTDDTFQAVDMMRVAD